MSLKAPAFDPRLQSFDESVDPKQGRGRVDRLRGELRRRGLDGFLVPRADEHQNEIVAGSAERLAWLTGFSGSAGMAVVLLDQAAIFVDGRYTLQVREQVDLDVFMPRHLVETPPDAWIEAHLKPGSRLGFDPWLHTPASVDRFRRAVKAAGAELVAVDSNPVDAVWSNRPEPPLGAVTLHGERFSGETAAEKIRRVQEALAKARSDALMVSDPHAVAWILNIRGRDVAHTPLPLSFAIVPRDGQPTLYIDARKLSNSVRDALGETADIAEPSALLADVGKLGARKARVRFDAATVPAKLVEALETAGGSPDVGADPTALMKAVKNATELGGARSAHLRDAGAFVRFLAWFDAEAPKGGLTEIDAAKALAGFRQETGELKDLSFPTIAGAGPNAAIPHYRVSLASNRPIEEGIFLVDSGAQFEDGTTDITRTLAVGKPTAEMRDRFTRVLKGMIAISRAVFPKGTSGAQIDAFARAALWSAGLDFDHGTGHGVGSYLSVHEGPQRISKLGTTPLEPGMIVSNEPGYYKAGAWGIRTENLVVVETRAIEGAERDMYGFETLTLAPIDLTLVEPDLLTDDEVDWLDAYHARVREDVSPLLDKATAKWLKHATRKVKNAA
jgi:Xaa-Pro aminopeptidase